MFAELVYLEGLMPKIRLNDCSFHYEDDNFTDPWVPSETVWIQHGFGRNSRFWYQWPTVLARDYRVIRRDMRGHGFSEAPGPDYEWSVDGLISDTMRFLDAIEVDSVHYVGESVGAMLGVKCAALWPDRFKSLTLCAMPDVMLPATVARSEDPLSVGTLEREDALKTLGVGKWAQSLMVPGVFAGMDGTQQRKDWLVSEWSRTPNHVACSLMHAVRGFDVRHHLPELKMPTLVLAPARSTVKSLASQVGIFEAVPGARIAVVDGPGHEIYFDRAQESATAVLEFLRAQRGRDSAETDFTTNRITR
jgi:pimeloyl-ACP methyl ester carboxylesterase